MSVLGIARELAAALSKPLRAPPIAAPLTAPPGLAATTGAAAAAATAGPSVSLTPGAGCARFLSCVIRGVANDRASPEWLAERLRRAGLRPISPIVDVTNLVLLELGQPMHAYDLAQLQGNICARRAVAGETVTLLDGQQLVLDAEVLAIADDAGVIGMAGIMGGVRSAITTGTTAVFLEVAWFAPAAIAGRARRYGLHTDASQRFERGVDPALQQRALERAVELIVAIAGGTVTALHRQELRAELPLRVPVPLRLARAEQLLGLAVDAATVTTKLKSLGMQVASAGNTFTITPPSWRFDIQIEADLVEEIARTVGLDAIPEASARQPHRFQSRPERRMGELAILQLLAARGYQEIVSFGFVDAARQRLLLGETSPPALRNPISSELGVMRASLWSGLVQTLQYNVRRQQERGRYFEVASCFVTASGQPLREVRRVAGIAYGSRLPQQWGSVTAAVDFHDVKGDIEALLAISGSDATYSFAAMTAPPPALHPGRSAGIECAGKIIGCIGEMHPQLLRVLELPAAPVLFELDRDAISQADSVKYRPLSVFPAIRRDLSFTVDVAESFSRIAERASVAASERLQELRIFDVYAGDSVESGRKSVALGLILQDLSRTLTDQEADETVAAVMRDLTAVLDAKLRD
jgi:phenylalanyl-tRNA synthetase beta chain